MKLNNITTTTFCLLASLMTTHKMGNAGSQSTQPNNGNPLCPTEWDNLIKDTLSCPSTLTYAQPEEFKYSTSKLGNNYEEIVPHQELADLIASCSIEFSSMISEENRAEYAKMIKIALPQRVNHEVLSNILLLPHFSIHVLLAREMPDPHIGGMFDYSTEILTLNTQIFFDDVWMLQPTLGNELSHAGMLTIPLTKKSDFRNLLAVTRGAGEILKEEMNALGDKILRLKKAIKENTVNTDEELKKQFKAIENFSPQAQSLEESFKDFDNSWAPVTKGKGKKNVLKEYVSKEGNYNLYTIQPNFSCSRKANLCQGMFFNVNPRGDIRDKMYGFYVLINNYKNKLFGDQAPGVYSQKNYDNKLIELISFFDSLQMPLKEAFFPKTCERLTEGYELSRASYCSY